MARTPCHLQELERRKLIELTVSPPAAPIALRPFSIDEYHWLIEQGFFHGDERVELIRGALHRMGPKGPRHAACQSKMLHQLFPRIGSGALIRAQGPITLPESNSEPEVDLVLAAPRDRGYYDRHPYAADVLLAVELADSSLEYDRCVKVPLYAAAGITEYWLVNLRENRIEVYLEPVTPVEVSPFYRQHLTYSAQDTIAPTRIPDCIFSVRDLLPV